MKQSLLEILRCPTTGKALEIKNATMANNEKISMEAPLAKG